MITVMQNQNGERDADFINCVIWRQQAKFVNWAKKGALVGITRSYQTRSMRINKGQRVYVH